MNETTIKEIKSIYSSRNKSKISEAATPEITLDNRKTVSKPFFYGVIDKLNIIVDKK